MTHPAVKTPQTAPTPCCDALSLGNAGPKPDPLRNTPRMIKHLYSLLIAAIMDSKNCNPPEIQAAPSFTRQPSVNLDATLDAFRQIAYPDANGEILSQCIPDSSTLLLAQFLARFAAGDGQRHRSRLPDRVLVVIHL